MLTALLALIIVLSDQASKFFISRALLSAPRRSLTVIENFFSLTLVYNRGGVFGLFPEQNTLFIVLSFLTIVGLVALLLRRRFFPPGIVTRFAGGLLLGGAVGNLIDRLRYDCVVDFLDFQFGGYHWPAFNLADSAICVGVAFLIGLTFFHKNKRGDECTPSSAG